MCVARRYENSSRYVTKVVKNEILFSYQSAYLLFKVWKPLKSAYMLGLSRQELKMTMLRHLLSLFSKR